MKPLFIEIPTAMKQEFKLHCVSSNIYRYTILAFFSLVVQILLLCGHVFFGIFGVAAESATSISKLYMYFSIAYVLVNSLLCVALYRMRKCSESEKSNNLAGVSVIIYLCVFFVMEFGLALIEAELFLSVYRVIYIFIILTFLHCDSRKRLVILFVSYAAAMIAICAALRLLELFHGNRLEAVIIVTAVFCVFFSLFRLHNALIFFIEQHENKEYLVRLHELNEMLQNITTTDSLTKINNRRSFDEKMPIIWDDGRRANSPITLLMIDIDHFKAFNDYFGHMQGDECLEIVAACIKTYLTRKTDFVSRYGGEEFVAVMPYTDGKTALSFIEELRAGVENMQVPSPGNTSSPYVTISIGAACMIPNADNDYKDLILAADKALYEAKNSGRNRIVTAFHACNADGNEQSQELDNCAVVSDFTAIEDIRSSTEEVGNDEPAQLSSPNYPTNTGNTLESALRNETSEVIAFFSVNMETGELTFSDEIRRFLSMPEARLGSMGEIMSFVHPDDIPACKQLINDTFETPASENKSLLSFVRIRNMMGNYIPVAILSIVMNTKTTDGAGADWFVRFTAGAFIEAQLAP